MRTFQNDVLDHDGDVRSYLVGGRASDGAPTTNYFAPVIHGAVSNSQFASGNALVTQNQQNMLAKAPEQYQDLARIVAQLLEQLPDQGDVTMRAGRMSKVAERESEVSNVVDTGLDGDLVERAKQVDARHRESYQRPISAEGLRKALGAGAERSRSLTRLVRSESRYPLAVNSEAAS